MRLPPLQHQDPRLRALEAINLQWLAGVKYRLPEILAQAKEATMYMPPCHPFAPFPDDPEPEPFTEEQIRILSGQLIKR